MIAKAKQGFRRCRRFVRAILGRDILQRREVCVPVQRHGNDYGGWMCCPEGLGSDSVVYSFGVGSDISFDRSVIQSFGCELYAFDPTPKSVEWVRQQSLPDRFHFYELGLAAHDGVASFEPPANDDHVSFSMIASRGAKPATTLPVRRLTTIMEMLGHTRIDILKMDIEGAEYDVLTDLAHCRPRVRQILVEFHHRFSRAHVARTRQAIGLLREAGYRIAHVTSNGEEYTFVAADLTQTACDMPYALGCRPSSSVA